MPAITPVQPTNPGINLSGAGVTIPASGVSATCPTPAVSVSGCRGPWFIERQDMRVEYFRVPSVSPSANTFNLTKPTVSYQTDYTHLQTKVNANYSVEKSYDQFNTSAFQQPQTFVYLSVSTDSQGNSYGDSSSMGVSCIGPTGSIETQQAWYKRRFWGPTDSETASSITGFRHYSNRRQYSNTNPPDNPFNWYNNGGIVFGDFTRACRNVDLTNPLQDETEWVPHPIGFELYKLPGTYSYTQENDLSVINYVNQVGNYVTTEQIFPASTGLSLVVPYNYLYGIPEYSTARHSWI
jgi:hypothetical protein